jgi:hypothetical protein
MPAAAVVRTGCERLACSTSVEILDALGRDLTAGH